MTSYQQALDELVASGAQRTALVGEVVWTWFVAGVTGGTQPAVLLLPGALGGAEGYWPVVREIGETRLVVMVRYPRADDIGKLVSGLAGILDAQGIAQAVVIGASFGGLVGQAFAAAHPSRVAALVLSGTGVPNPTRQAQIETWSRRVMHMPAWLLRGLFRVLIWSLLLGVRHERTFWLNFYNRELPSLTPELLSERYRLTLSLDRMNPDASAVSRVLCLAGSRDRVARPTEQAKLRARFPHATFIVFPGLGHGLLTAAPREWMAHVREFLAPPV